MMKEIVILSALLSAGINHVMAQSYGEDSKYRVHTADSLTVPQPYGQQSQQSQVKQIHTAKVSRGEGMPIDSLHLPVINTYGQVLPVAYPTMFYSGWNNWNLHQGLNVSIGASVFASFGKNAPKGAGFSQQISALYAIPLNNKLSLAVGGYFNNVYWMHDNYRDGGLTAVLGYKFNERWEGYIYAQKSIVNNHQAPYPLYYMHSLGDRLGAALKYNFNRNISMQLSVEGVWLPKQQGQYFDQYNYPVPGL